jgi:hypothetical protein
MHPTRNLSESFLVHDGGAHFGELTFVRVRENLEEDIRNYNIKNRITEKFESLVVAERDAFLLKELMPIRGMGQGLKQKAPIPESISQLLL